MEIALSEPTGPGSGGGSNRSIETGRIGKPIMPLHSELVVRNSAPIMIKRTEVRALAAFSYCKLRRNTLRFSHLESTGSLNCIVILRSDQIIGCNGFSNSVSLLALDLLPCGW